MKILIILQNSHPEYKNNINKALDFITRTLDGSDNLHAMAIGTYVLAKANHNSKVAFLQRLDAMAVNEGRFIYFFFNNKENCITLYIVLILRWPEMVE